MTVQNVQASLERVSTVSHIFKKVAPAMKKSSGGKPLACMLEKNQEGGS